MTRRDILVIGNANLDVIIGPVDAWPERGTESFFPHGDLRIGGSAANTAIVLQRLGARSGLFSACGTDFAGTAIGDAFSGSRDHIRAINGATGFTVGLLHPASERTFLSSAGHLNHLDANFFRTALEGVVLEGALVMLSGGFAMPALIEGHVELQNWLRERGAQVAIDPGWPDGDWTSSELDLVRQWMAASDHVLINEKEAVSIAGTDDLNAAIGRLAGLLAPSAALVVKRGPDGASAYQDAEALNVTTMSVDPIDTVGAGDSFNAGYLDALSRGLAMRHCLERAVAVAGHVIAEFPRSSDPISIDDPMVPA